MIELFQKTQLSANLIRSLPKEESEKQILDCILRAALAAGVRFHKEGSTSANIQAATMLEQAAQITANFQDFSPTQVYDAFSLAVNGKLPFCTKEDVPNNYAKVFTHYREYQAFRAATTTKKPIKEDTAKIAALNNEANAQILSDFKAFQKAFKKALKSGKKATDLYYQLLGGNVSEVKMSLWYTTLKDLKVFKASKELVKSAETVAYDVMLNKIMNPTAHRDIQYSVKQAIKESYPTHIHQILKDNSYTLINVYLFRANVEPFFKVWLIEESSKIISKWQPEH